MQLAVLRPGKLEALVNRGCGAVLLADEHAAFVDHKGARELFYAGRERRTKQCLAQVGVGARCENLVRLCQKALLEESIGFIEDEHFHAVQSHLFMLNRMD